MCWIVSKSIWNFPRYTDYKQTSWTNRQTDTQSDNIPSSHNCDGDNNWCDNLTRPLAEPWPTHTLRGMQKLRKREPGMLSGRSFTVEENKGGYKIKRYRHYQDRQNSRVHTHTHAVFVLLGHNHQFEVLSPHDIVSPQE